MDNMLKLTNTVDEILKLRKMDNLIICRLVMLPRDKYTNGTILRNKDGFLRYQQTNWLSTGYSDTGWKMYHLYLVSDREIKDGDKFYSIGTNRIYTNVLNVFEPGDVKVEATTDKSLGLPLILLKWIEEVYVPSNGSIKEVKIIMKEQYQVPDCYDEQQWKEEDYNTKRKYLKLSPSLEGRGGERHVMILPIKDSWTREEVKKACHRFHDIRVMQGSKAANEWFDKNY